MARHTKKRGFRNKVKVVFKKGRKTWTKYFKSKSSAKRAVRGLQSKTNWKAVKKSLRRL